ncbi:MAG: osmotically inducible protein OsmC [Desulfobacteraceae bacterium]|mgnify:CR=1 FL=1|nr:MAG: osmotically inducible protein OsmC [Desulfobacteraceae bacterium]
MKSYEAVFPGNKKVDVTFGEFSIQTDQSKKNEGDETAPEPFDLFLSSLAACAGIYAKSFCDTRKIDTAGMKIVQEVFRKEKQKLLDEVRITLYVNDRFPDKYRTAVIKSMSGCAVKNQLHPDIRFSTEVKSL